MSLTLRRPPEKTIAFGGVATGNIKANEHEIVAGIMRYSGFTQILSPYDKKSVGIIKPTSRLPDAMRKDKNKYDTNINTVIKTGG